MSVRRIEMDANLFTSVQLTLAGQWCRRVSVSDRTFAGGHAEISVLHIVCFILLLTSNN